MKLYVAGPMSNLPEYNLPAFAEATAQLEAAGYEVVNPGRRGVIEGCTWSDYLRLSLADLLACEGVAVLPRWKDSKGARLEVHVAEELGMAVRAASHWLSMVLGVRP